MALYDIYNDKTSSFIYVFKKYSLFQSHHIQIPAVTNCKTLQVI